MRLVSALRFGGGDVMRTMTTMMAIMMVVMMTMMIIRTHAVMIAMMTMKAAAAMMTIATAVITAYCAGFRDESIWLWLGAGGFRRSARPLQGRTCVHQVTAGGVLLGRHSIGTNFQFIGWALVSNLHSVANSCSICC